MPYQHRGAQSCAIVVRKRSAPIGFSRHALQYFASLFEGGTAVWSKIGTLTDRGIDFKRRHNSAPSMTGIIQS
ncbi:hypothetical protein [Paraburkholderia tuberum]|uniref:hypothetical protein n=1 Tax=Paraburkholderia TaxID=1822464 RepID=UPI000368D6C6|nr:hypothetical protein [Paraburkholderia tuberum]